MNLYDYQHEVAIRTMNHDLGPQTQLANLTLGIVGEFAELKFLHLTEFPPSEEQIKDEGGDVLWYLANLCNVLSIELSQLGPSVYTHNTEPMDLIDDSMLSFGTIADVVKKTVAQGHVLDIEVIVAETQELLYYLTGIINYYDLTIEEVCAYNHQKLLKRYPDGFEASRSVNRG